MRLGFIIGLFLLSSVVAVGQSSPNLLWITCEDMSANLPAYGDKTVPTPNLDRLAREGVRHRRMFSVSGVCAPSRSAIITGMYPTQIGSQHMRTIEAARVGNGLINYEAVPPAPVRCFSEYLRASTSSRSGYFCTNGEKTDYQFRSPFTAWNVDGREGQTTPWRGRQPGQAFFSVINLSVTHESQVWARANQPLRVDPARVTLPPYYPDNAIVRRDIARYYDNIMVMDSLVGVVLTQLEADGLLDKTVILFFSDHGAGLPWYKREIYDRGLHVPLIVRYPNQRGAGTWDDDLHSFVDLAPSMLSLANVPIPAHLPGQAFLGKQAAKAPRRYIYAARDRHDEHYDMARAVRDRRFKYIRNYQPSTPYYKDLAYRKQMPMMRELLRLREAGQLPATTQRWFGAKPAEELYDTDKDPYELTNLADDPAHQRKLNELREAEQAWVRTCADKGFMQERDLISLFWPANQQPKTAPPTASVSNGTVTLTCPTEGASIGYRIGTDAWQLYTRPISLKPGESLTARAVRIGYAPSLEVGSTTSNARH